MGWLFQSSGRSEEHGVRCSAFVFLSRICATPADSGWLYNTQDASNPRGAWNELLRRRRTLTACPRCERRQRPGRIRYQSAPIHIAAETMKRLMATSEKTS
jgi:hypothetical protein